MTQLDGFSDFDPNPEERLCTFKVPSKEGLEAKISKLSESCGELKDFAIQ